MAPPAGMNGEHHLASMPYTHRGHAAAQPDGGGTGPPPAPYPPGTRLRDMALTARSRARFTEDELDEAPVWCASEGRYMTTGPPHVPWLTADQNRGILPPSVRGQCAGGFRGDFAARRGGIARNQPFKRAPALRENDLADSAAHDGLLTLSRTRGFRPDELGAHAPAPVPVLAPARAAPVDNGMRVARATPSMGGGVSARNGGIVDGAVNPSNVTQDDLKRWGREEMHRRSLGLDGDAGLHKDTVDLQEHMAGMVAPSGVLEKAGASGLHNAFRDSGFQRRIDYKPHHEYDALPNGFSIQTKDAYGRHHPLGAERHEQRRPFSMREEAVSTLADPMRHQRRLGPDNNPDSPMQNQRAGGAFNAATTVPLDFPTESNLRVTADGRLAERSVAAPNAARVVGFGGFDAAAAASSVGGAASRNGVADPVLRMRAGGAPTGPGGWAEPGVRRIAQAAHERHYLDEGSRAAPFVARLELGDGPAPPAAFSPARAAVHQAAALARTQGAGGAPAMDGAIVVRLGDARPLEMQGDMRVGGWARPVPAAGAAQHGGFEGIVTLGDGAHGAGVTQEAFAGLEHRTGTAHVMGAASAAAHSAGWAHGAAATLKPDGAAHQSSEAANWHISRQRVRNVTHPKHIQRIDTEELRDYTVAPPDAPGARFSEPGQGGGVGARRAERVRALHAPQHVPDRRDNGRIRVA